MPVRPASALRTALVAAVAAGALVLSACAPDPTPSTPPPAPSPSVSTTATAGAPSPSPSPSASGAPVALPTDCRAVLSDAVLAQLSGVPLNDPATGEQTGVLADGSLVCLWRDARADTTFLRTEISRLSRGPALDLLNGLTSEGFTCYTPDGGTRCEATWPNPQYPVTDGRTLFWRDDVLIDTTFSNLAPSGYTDAIVTRVFS